MVIEWLKFQVEKSYKDIFLGLDRKIWTSRLSRCRGFVDKEIWFDPDDDTVIIIVIRWQTRDLWKRICVADLESINSQFQEAMGDIPYKMLESREFFL